MKWIPSVPTDCLYKFTAISGMWMAFGLLIFFGWLISIDIQMERDRRATQAYFFSVNTLRDIDRRLAAIEEGQMDEARLSWVHHSWSPEQELHFLAEAANNHRSTIEQYKHVLESDPGKELEVFKRRDVQALGVVYIFLTVVLLIYGFGRWKTRIHDVDMQLRTLELKARKVGLEKLEIELAEARRTRWRNRWSATAASQPRLTPGVPATLPRRGNGPGLTASSRLPSSRKPRRE